MFLHIIKLQGNTVSTFLIGTSANNSNRATRLYPHSFCGEQYRYAACGTFKVDNVSSPSSIIFLVLDFTRVVLHDSHNTKTKLLMLLWPLKPNGFSSRLFKAPLLVNCLTFLQPCRRAHQCTVTLLCGYRGSRAHDQPHSPSAATVNVAGVEILLFTLAYDNALRRACKKWTPICN